MIGRLLGKGMTMKMKFWLTSLALAATAAAGTSLEAGLLERLSRTDEPRMERDDFEESFEVASNDEIGKIITPVAYQTLAAPDGGALAPVPQSYPAPGSAYHGPAIAQPLPSGSAGVPIESWPATGPMPPLGSPAGPMGPAAFSAGPHPGFGGYPLFSRVEVEDRHHIHPCAVPTIVQVLDPCADACDSCGPRCVYVEICVPPGCPEIKVRRHGRKVKYDYGDYKVVVTSRDGYVKVDYDD